RRGDRIKPAGLERAERVVQVNRVAKVVKGGRRFSFSALVVVGAQHDIVGVGHGKAREVPVAIQKAIEDAKKNLFRVPKHGSTITHTVTGRQGAGIVLLKPASPGTGVIAGGPVRAVLELAGISDILSKSLGSTDPVNLLAATVAGPPALRPPGAVGRRSRPGAAGASPTCSAGRPTVASSRPRPASRRPSPRSRPSPPRSARDPRHPGALVHRDDPCAPRHATRARAAEDRPERRAPRHARAARAAPPRGLPGAHGGGGG